MVGTVLRGTLRVAGELLVTLGLVVLLFAAYEVYGKTAAINDHQNALDHQFDQAPLVPPAGAGPAAARQRDRPAVPAAAGPALGRGGGGEPAGHPVRTRPLPRHGDARAARQLRRRRAPGDRHVLGSRPAPPG